MPRKSAKIDPNQGDKREIENQNLSKKEKEVENRDLNQDKGKEVIAISLEKIE